MEIFDEKNFDNAFEELQRGLVENLNHFVSVNQKEPKIKKRKSWITYQKKTAADKNCLKQTYDCNGNSEDRKKYEKQCKVLKQSIISKMKNYCWKN